MEQGPMTPEQAICRANEMSNGSASDNMFWATVISALEKQVKKRVVNPFPKECAVSYAMCCQACRALNVFRDYCEHCGQALDWME